LGLQSPGGLTPGYLRVLHRQQGPRELVQKELLAHRWGGLCLGDEAFHAVWDLAAPDGELEVPWPHVVAIASGVISQVSPQIFKLS